jgi:hypothetical protein
MLEILPSSTINPTHSEFKRAMKGEIIHLPAREDEEGQYHEVYLVPIKDEKDTVTGVLWMLNGVQKERNFISTLQ